MTLLLSENKMVNEPRRDLVALDVPKGILFKNWSKTSSSRAVYMKFYRNGPLGPVKFWSQSATAQRVRVETITF